MRIPVERPLPAGGLVLLVLAAFGCSGGVQTTAAPRTGKIPEVIFSVANADRSAASAEIEIKVNGFPVIYGSFSQSPAGKYMYFSSRIPEKKMVIRVVSRSESGVVEAQRTAIVEDRAWIVVTLLERDGRSELEIAISYENPIDKDAK